MLTIDPWKTKTAGSSAKRRSGRWFFPIYLQWLQWPAAHTAPLSTHIVLPPWAFMLGGEASDS